MKQARWWGLALCIAVTSASASPARLAFSPVPAVSQEGQPFTLDVTISEVADLYAFQFDLGFDPAIIRIVGVSEGSFLGAGGATTFFVPGDIDNVLGTLSFTGSSLIGAVPGGAGAGILARLSLQALAPGSSDLMFSNVTLLDSALTEIDTVAVAGSFVVNAVPEPATMWLAAIGVAGLYGWARCRAVGG